MTLKSEALIAAMGVVGAFVLTGLSSGWEHAALAWMVDVLLVLTPHWAMLVLPIVASCLVIFIHTQYRNPWSIGLVVCLSLLFGIGHLATGSLLVAMVTHAAYDAAILFYERHRMATDPNYFGGKVPNDIVRKLIEEQAEARKRKQTAKRVATVGEQPRSPVFRAASTAQPAQAQPPQSSTVWPNTAPSPESQFEAQNQSLRWSRESEGIESCVSTPSLLCFPSSNKHCVRHSFGRAPAKPPHSPQSSFLCRKLRTIQALSPQSYRRRR